jgi:hypothetical protein
VTVLTSGSGRLIRVGSVPCDQQKRDIDFQGLEYWKVGDLERRTDVLPLPKAFAAAKVSERCGCLTLQPKVTKTATLTAPAPVSHHL